MNNGSDPARIQKHSQSINISHCFDTELKIVLPPWGPRGLSRECVLRIPMRVVKGD